MKERLIFETLEYLWMQRAKKWKTLSDNFEHGENDTIRRMVWSEMDNCDAAIDRAKKSIIDLLPKN